MIYRFTYEAKASRRMPATKDAVRVPDIHERDAVASMLGVPAGYAGEHPPVSRGQLPPTYANTLRNGDRLTDDEAEWEDTHEMKYTAYELHERAQHVQNLWDKAVMEVQPPLHQQSPEDRKKAWKKLMKDAGPLHTETGLRGMPGYSRLSYFRCLPWFVMCPFSIVLHVVWCVLLPASVTAVVPPVHRYEHFFHFALAHLLLYGIVKDFWNVWTRPEDSKQKPTGAKSKRRKKHRLHGIIYILPRYIREAIKRRAENMRWTAQLKKRSADVLGYETVTAGSHSMRFADKICPYICGRVYMIVLYHVQEQVNMD